MSFLSVVVVATNLCSSCSGVGRVQVPCPDCRGKGYFYRQGTTKNIMLYKIPCRKCSEITHFSGGSSYGAGKVWVKCQKCDGKKFVPAKNDSKK